ncbi:hypothetical protein M2282_001047 [Variovorax boronicumulans]|nr:hypothetical protein [Variovorax boronicumulans]
MPAQCDPRPLRVSMNAMISPMIPLRNANTQISKIRHVSLGWVAMLL